MQAIPANQGNNFQYAVIGRLNKEHNTHALSPHQIKEQIANALCINIDASHIVYLPPNYIIQLDDGHEQAHILATHPLIHTNYFVLELLPWSKEHEWCQLPWITEHGSKNSDVAIDPLKILPIVPVAKRQSGSYKLKDSFAAMIPKNYDLRSPDYSYLLITEIKEFYYMKSRVFRKYKKNFTSIQNANHTFYPIVHSLISNIRSYIQSLQCVPTIESMPHVHAFSDDLRDVDKIMKKAISILDINTEKMCRDTGVPIDLQGFRNEPSSSKIPAPREYVDRLKAIFRAAIEKIHNTTPIIETTEANDKRFQTYITINNFTSTYYGEHEITAQEMEASAIFYYLKQISNVQGYKIIDLNYPILSDIVTAIDRWNQQINILDFLIDNMIEEAKNIDKVVMKAYQSAKLEEVGPKESQYIKDETSKLLDALNEHWTILNTVCYEAHNYKEEYHSTVIDVYSPSRSYYRLGRAHRPVLHTTIT